MYSRITITGSGTEKQFLDAFTGLIVGSGAGITCTDDYTSKLSTDDATPSFTLHVGSALDIVFARNDVSQVYTTGYTVSVPQISSVGAALYWGGSLYSGERSVRTWGIDIICNPDKSFTILNLGGLIDLSDYPNRELSIIVMRGAKNGFAAQQNVYMQIPDPIISLPLKLTNNTSITKCDRIPYIYNPNDQTRLQVIRSKMFKVTESDNASLEIATLYDVSTVTAGSLVIFGGNKYYALDAHTLMEVDTVAAGS